MVANLVLSELCPHLWRPPNLTILDDRRKPLTRFGAIGVALARGLIASYTIYKV
jgi:hypothetical protein